MSKIFLEDMVKAKRARQTTPLNVPANVKIESVKRNNKKGGSRLIFWSLAAVCVVFFLFSLSSLFGKATVTINPKTQEIVLNENLSASKDASGENLSFDLVVISGEENKTVKATLEKDVLKKAEGVVVIYNTFSSAPQALNIDTRLEGSNGKIYKTQTKTIVPGKTADDKPGSVEVKIYATEPGTEYNSAPLDFKIFGFKGTPKYSKFYGRSKGEISGGQKGKFGAIGEDERVSLVNEMKVALQAKLLSKALDQIPSGFILFKDGVFLNTEESENETESSSEDKMLTLKVKGTLQGLLFNEENLVKKIAKDNIEKYDGSKVIIPNIRKLNFSVLNKDSIVLGDAKNINFNLSGSVKITWQFDDRKLVIDLLGKSKKDFNQILSKYPNIDSADLVVSPLWRRSVPDDIKKIKIMVNYPN